MFSITSC